MISGRKVPPENTETPVTLRIPPVSAKPGWLPAVWETISQTGLVEIAVRLGTHVLLIASILIVALGLRFFYSEAEVLPLPLRKIDLAGTLPATASSMQAAQLPALAPPTSMPAGVSRLSSLHTDLPSRQRFETIAYTVQDGENVITIADKFGLKPETVLWANQSSLADNPHNIRPGMVLTILPVDGAYHRWSAGDGLATVAKFFHVDPENILSYPGNQLKPDELGDLTNPSITAGKWLIIPGGTRDFVTWKVPEIPRDDPDAAKILGTGTCEQTGEGPVGSGNFIWPADIHYLSGYDFLPNANHYGIDLASETGSPAYAADSGVVVYAGWNNWGYGNLVIINHGNDWQTLYAHLSDLYVICGQTVWQGGVVGLVGTPGDAALSGSNLPSSTPQNLPDTYLHFEMMFEGTPANPHDYLP